VLATARRSFKSGFEIGGRRNAAGQIDLSMSFAVSDFAALNRAAPCACKVQKLGHATRTYLGGVVHNGDGDMHGAPRIHGELLKLGIDVSQSAFAKYMVRRRHPPSQTWRTFLANHVGQIMAADFFVVPTATGRLCSS
jgi:hypothetical protein